MADEKGKTLYTLYESIENANKKINKKPRSYRARWGGY